MIINANALHIPLANQSVHCAVTSPPYWGLRDYGYSDQIGLEPTPELYVSHLVEVFREVWRVLRDDGTLWLNLGDSYNSAPASSGISFRRDRAEVVPVKSKRLERGSGRYGGGNVRTDSCKPKDLVGIPWMVAFALRADGWYLRSDIIWSKPNPMPESVTDRPTKSHEYVFLLAKQARYFYDAEAIKEPTATFDTSLRDRDSTRLNSTPGRTRMAGLTTNDYETRNRRTVWTIPTNPYSGAHFATFPPDLVAPMVLAGCPKDGIVLDPFCGSATVGEVCRQSQRRFVGLDLSMTYLRDLALPRAEGKQHAAANLALPLFAL